MKQILITPEIEAMAEEYAKGRGFDAETCYEMIAAYRHADKGNEKY